VNGSGSGNANEWRVKVGLAEMLKGGSSWMYERRAGQNRGEGGGLRGHGAGARPSDIRKEGGVARMASIKVIREIMATVTIPVMAKVRIGHFMEAEVLQALEVDFIDESEVLTPADEENHIWKHDYRVPFVCGARNLGKRFADRRRRGDDPHERRGRLGNVVEAVRHMRTIVSQMKRLTTMREDELMHEAKELGLRSSWSGKLPRLGSFPYRISRSASPRRQTLLWCAGWARRRCSLGPGFQIK